MKTIGLIGGMSCESTALYYQWLNDGTRERLGGLHSAEIVLWSVDFARIEKMQEAGDWDTAGGELAAIAARLQDAGAEIVVLATNTMHRVAGHIEGALRVPFLHIGDATGEAVKSAGCRRPGLLATRYTMQGEFYAGRLRETHGLDVIVPEEPDASATHAIIYDELCRGIISENSRNRFVEIAERLVKRGADSLILGCTEVTLLLGQDNVTVPVFDTARIHVDRTLDLALDRTRFGNAA